MHVQFIAVHVCEFAVSVCEFFCISKQYLELLAMLCSVAAFLRSMEAPKVNVKVQVVVIATRAMAQQLGTKRRLQAFQEESLSAEAQQELVEVRKNILGLCDKCMHTGCMHCDYEKCLRFLHVKEKNEKATLEEAKRLQKKPRHFQSCRKPLRTAEPVDLWEEPEDSKCCEHQFTAAGSNRFAQIRTCYKCYLRLQSTRSANDDSVVNAFYLDPVARSEKQINQAHKRSSQVPVRCASNS
jgi:hypothetical protein